MTCPRALAVLAAAALGVALGACSGSLYDPDQVPAKAAGGGLVCTPPAHACGGACVSQSVDHCGSSCQVCGAPPLNATEDCLPAAGGDYACVYTCSSGFFTCAAGCCRATDVAAGGNHACAILDDGSLSCWGANDAGQLGVTTPAASSERPVQSLASGVTAVALGGRHTCALQSGAVVCFGANDDGQLGSGAVGGGGPTPVIASLAGGATATALAAGGNHSCALVTGGAVQCWGWNLYGQLGIGGTSPDKEPAPTPSLVTSTATAVAARADTTCAIVGSQVQCFGANGTGQIGNPSASNPQPTPDPVSLTTTGGALPGFIAVGNGHACAGLSPGGRVNSGLWCWGDNSRTQLGSNSTVTTAATPIRADKIDNSNPGQSILAIAGAEFTCSSKDAIEFKCAGANESGQVGAPPAPVAEGTFTFGGNNILGASAGLAHACALVDLTPSVAPKGVVMCWGANAQGQLGRATTPAGSPASSPGLVGP